MKNLSKLQKVLFSSKLKTNFSFFNKINNYSSNILTTQKFNFGSKKKTSIMNDLMSKDSKALDESSLSEENRSNLYNKTKEDKKEKATQAEINLSQISPSDKITTKILCDLIGSKHYPSNEEITVSGDSVVTVYDENDKLLGNMFLNQALENANSLDKDIVLRNDKIKPPIVKMMKYRVELVKRLFKKLGKNLGKDVSTTAVKHKIFGFSLNMEKNDFDSKVDKLRQLLTENNYVKVVIPVDLNSNENIVRSNSVLKNIASEVSGLAKIRAGPIKQKKRKENIMKLDPSITSDFDELSKHDRVIKDAYETASLVYVESEKDLDFIDSCYIELESLVVDNTGIDYEKLLKTTSLDMLVRGVTHSNLIGEINSASTKSGLSKEVLEDKLAKGISSFSSGADLSLKKQLKNLEKEAVVQNDYSKRIKIQEKINNMKEELYNTELKYNTKIMKLKMMELTKLAAKKEGLLDRNKV